MGSEPPDIKESTRDMLISLAAYAPDALRAIADTTPYTANKQLQVEQATAPGYAALQNQIYRDYGPEANRVGSEINRANQLAAAETERQLAAGPGAQLVDLAREQQERLDPEFYKSRASVSDALNKYLISYSPTELTGSEIEQISRGISGREGPLTPSALKTIKNAQTFGNAATQRWQNFGNAVLQGASALPAMKSGLTGFEIATRRPLVSNTGENRLGTPASAPASTAFNTNFGFANNVLNEAGATQRTIINKNRDFDERVNQAIGSLSGII